MRHSHTVGVDKLIKPLAVLVSCLTEWDCDMISRVKIVLFTTLQLLVLQPTSHSLPGLVITIKADEKQSNPQFHFTLRTEREELRLDEVSAHPPLTSYTPPASASYRPPHPSTYQRSEPPTFRPPQTSYRPAYHSNTNSITRYKKHRPGYKPPPVYKPSKSFSRNKKWKSRRRGLGPPKKRNIFPKFLEFLRSKRK